MSQGRRLTLLEAVLNVVTSVSAEVEWSVHAERFCGFWDILHVVYRLLS